MSLNMTTTVKDFIGIKKSCYVHREIIKMLNTYFHGTSRFVIQSTFVTLKFRYILFVLKLLYMTVDLLHMYILYEQLFHETTFYASRIFIISAGMGEHISLAKICLVIKIKFCQTNVL